ncbi:MAG TPA: ion channel [Bryobacteraceae bacterium]|nr:ion channel [Bryobacteraceae bacterium]
MKKESFDPGLTTQFSGNVRRVINPDGTFNVHRKGTRLRDTNLYLKMIDTSWTNFFVVVLLVFLVVNIAFAVVYVAIGIDQLQGTEREMSAFVSAFFFSVHTLTTVGYGNVFPRGVSANALAAIEAATGLMVFAVMTGLLYGRFSRPSARILFSKNALIAPYQEGTSLQFRITNARSNTLMNLEARVLLMTVTNKDGQLKRDFIDLELERRKVYFLPLTWTIVHPIDSSSPLSGKTAEDLAKASSEILILIQAFDDSFSQVVHSIYSYRYADIKWGAKFVQAFSVDPQGDLILELERIHELKILS